MSSKVHCESCGVLILPRTAQRNSGLCVPCKTGRRREIENAKAIDSEERVLDATCPFRALWRDILEKVENETNGFSRLSDEEKQYYAVGVLVSDVFADGFRQYFELATGEYYRYSELGLIRIGATTSLRLLRRAKSILFGDKPIPDDPDRRQTMMRSVDEDAPDLDALESDFYADPDGVEERLNAFAIEVGLVHAA